MTGVDLALPDPGIDTTDADQLAAFVRALVGAAFKAENVGRQADHDPTVLSMSGVGGCGKQGAYSEAHAAARARVAAGEDVEDEYLPTDIAAPEEAREAVLGTWIHDHLIPWMVKLVRGLGLHAVGEHRVQLAAGGLTILGTLDLVIVFPDGTEVVLDLKSVKEWRLHGVRRHGVYLPHELQVGGYALARRQAGHNVRWVVWIYIDRSTGEVHLEVKPFVNALVLAVVDRLTSIGYHAGRPDLAPREARGPGISLACDRCPWLQRCWEKGATPGKVGAQRILAATPEGIEAALALYARALAVESPAVKDKAFAKAIVHSANVPDGTYGDHVLKHGRATEMVDMDAVEAFYAEHGVDVPKRPKAGAMRVSPAPQRSDTG